MTITQEKDVNVLHTTEANVVAMWIGQILESMR